MDGRSIRRALVTLFTLVGLVLLGSVGLASADEGPIGIPEEKLPSPSPSASPSGPPITRSAWILWCMSKGNPRPQCEALAPASETPASTPSYSSGALNPLGNVAEECGKAAAWIVRKLGEIINTTTQVDFTNPSFIKQYAIVFAASAFLTLILWMLAVTKRAIRGAPLTEAVTEAVGFLWLTVIASAFTPLVLHMTVQLTDTLSDAIGSGTKDETKTFLEGFAVALEKGQVGGGPVMLIFLSLLAVVASAIIWVELLVRAAMLYVGAVLGTAVYSGLVDRNLWRHVRRWAGVMIAIVLAKPIIVIVLSLATAVTTSTTADPFATVLTGLAIMFLSIFASAAIYRFVPSFGDDMSALYSTRRRATAAAPAMVTGPASMMRDGIAAHGNRSTGGGGAAGGGALPNSAGVMAAGAAAHGARAAYRAVSQPATPPTQGAQQSAPPPQPVRPPPAPRPGTPPGRDS